MKIRIYQKENRKKKIYISFNQILKSFFFLLHFFFFLFWYEIFYFHNFGCLFPSFFTGKASQARLRAKISSIFFMHIANQVKTIDSFAVFNRKLARNEKKRVEIEYIEVYVITFDFFLYLFCSKFSLFEFSSFPFFSLE